jgi:hypothetical protein
MVKLASADPGMAFFSPQSVERRSLGYFVAVFFTGFLLSQPAAASAT